MTPSLILPTLSDILYTYKDSDIQAVSLWKRCPLSIYTNTGHPLFVRLHQSPQKNRSSHRSLSDALWQFY